MFDPRVVSNPMPADSRDQIVISDEGEGILHNAYSPLSNAVYAVSSNLRCNGSIASASAGVIEKKGASKVEMS